MHSLPVKRINIHPLSVPLKRSVEHAAAVRTVSEPIVVSVELMNGCMGYGETLPRPYVTGEDNASVIDAIQTSFIDPVLELRPRQWADAMEIIEALPFADRDGRPCPAARAAIELALVDAYSRAFGRSVAEVAGWLGLAGFGTPGSHRTIRFSAVLASRSVSKLVRTARLLKLYRLRDFKLKVGYPEDDERIAAVLGVLRRLLKSGRATLRIDANCEWTAEEAIERLHAWRNHPIAGVEQPLPKDKDRELVVVKEATDAPLFHDESLVTQEDADRLADLGVADGFNIRLSKCGGFMPALRLAAFARNRGAAIQFGCMVGETSILSAAGVRFLETTPGVRFAEGCFGSFLLRDDIIARPLRFGLGGRPPKLQEEGWGIEVDEQRLRRLAKIRPIGIDL